MKIEFDYVDALESLFPNNNWSIVGNDYSSLQWFDEDVVPPSEETLKEEIEKLKVNWKNNEYKRLRKEEYPDFFEYLDGVVKNDQEQIKSYIDKCLAVKEKYPKPE